MEPLVYGDIGQIVLKILYTISTREKDKYTSQLILWSWYYKN